MKCLSLSCCLLMTILLAVSRVADASFISPRALLQGEEEGVMMTLSSVTPQQQQQASVVARAVLEKLFQGSCAKDKEIINASFAENATVAESDHQCYGPVYGKKDAFKLMTGNFQFYSIMMRPIGSVVAMFGTDSDPSTIPTTGGGGGSIQFSATFTDTGVFPVDIRNETKPDWSFLTDSMVTGEIDRNQKLTKLHLFMPWKSEQNTELALAAEQYFVTMTNGTSEQNSALFTENAVISGRGENYLSSASGGNRHAYNWTGNLTAFTALLKATYPPYRTHGDYKLRSVTSGCNKAAVFNTVQSERYVSSSRTGPRTQFTAFGAHVFHFAKQGSRTVGKSTTPMIEKMEWIQLQTEYTTEE